MQSQLRLGHEGYADGQRRERLRLLRLERGMQRHQRHCRLSITGARRATAIFNQNIYTLTVGRPARQRHLSPSGINCGTSCSASYAGGTTSP
jgi:hypothetical protein